MFLIELYFNFKINMFFKKYTRKIVLHNYEKQHVYKNVNSIVVNELCYKKIFDLIKLFEVAIRSKILFYNIVLLFRLFIDLKIKNNKKTFENL